MYAAVSTAVIPCFLPKLFKYSYTESMEKNLNSDWLRVAQFDYICKNSQGCFRQFDWLIDTFRRESVGATWPST